MSSTRVLPDRRHLGMVAAAGVFAATALVDIAGRPDMDPAGHHFHGAAAYALTACLVPFAGGAVAVAAALRSFHPGRSHSRVAFGLVVASAVGFTICAAGSLANTDPRFGGPLYPVSVLATLIGLGVLAVRAARTQAVRTWMAVAIPLAWLVGGPLAEGQLFRGAALILAAVTAALAAPSAGRVAGPVAQATLGANA